MDPALTLLIVAAVMLVGIYFIWCVRARFKPGEEDELPVFARDDQDDPTPAPPPPYSVSAQVEEAGNRRNKAEESEFEELPPSYYDTVFGIASVGGTEEAAAAVADRDVVGARAAEEEDESGLEGLFRRLEEEDRRWQAGSEDGT